jgi:hypothetical protein
MNDQELLEMFRRNLQRQDFTKEEKAAKRLVTRRHMEKMGIDTCAYGNYSCVEDGTHEYMKGVFICRTHHEKGGAIAVCARCTHCFAWVVLIGRSTNTEPMVYEVQCPVDSCGDKFVIKSGDTKYIGLPNTVIDRGYFREGELET